MRIDWMKWDVQLGTASDKTIANKIGCKVLAVKHRRKKLNILPFAYRKYASLYKPAALPDLKSCAAVYSIVNTVNGEEYIGASRRVRGRALSHRRALATGICPFPKLAEAIRIYGGQSFRFNLVEICDESKLWERERYWIAKRRPAYNLI